MAVVGVCGLAVAIAQQPTGDAATTKAPAAQPSGDAAKTQAEAPTFEAPDGTKMAVVKEAKIAVNLAIEVQDLKLGEGKEVTPSSWLRVHYRGTFRDGREFDSSIKRNEPAVFPLEGVIEGWQMGMLGMKAGGIRRLVIPYQLAYGAAGRPPVIPAKSDLIFSVQLLEVLDGPPQPAAQPQAPQAQPPQPQDRPR